MLPGLGVRLLSTSTRLPSCYGTWGVVCVWQGGDALHTTAHAAVRVSRGAVLSVAIVRGGTVRCEALIAVQHLASAGIRVRGLGLGGYTKRSQVLKSVRPCALSCLFV